MDGVSAEGGGEYRRRARFDGVEAALVAACWNGDKLEDAADSQDDGEALGRARLGDGYSAASPRGRASYRLF